MGDEDIRLECLRFATISSVGEIDGKSAVERATEYYEFVTNQTKKTEPLKAVA